MPKRRLAALAGAFLAASFAAWWPWQRLPPGPFVIISIDTLRADHLAAYGYSKGQTPAMDAFARDAVVFDRAYAHVPLTLPSHASILTGQLPFEHGVRDNLGFTLKDTTPTLASLLSGAGYSTGAFVSTYVLRSETGIGHGFGVYNAEVPPGTREQALAQLQRPGFDTLAAAEAWLGTLADDRFLLFFHVYEPHKPYGPPSKYSALAPYDGEVAAADEVVGALLSDLKRRGWYDSATIVVLSDHGEGLGDHGEEEHGLFVYDATVRVPLFVKLPAGRGGGRRIADPVQHIDLLPTVAELAGLPAPAGLRGRSLVSSLREGGQVLAQGIYSEALYARYHFGWSELESLTDSRYRFIKAPRPELYDLERDPAERVNLVSTRSQMAGAMSAGLEALVAGRGIQAPAVVSAEDRQRLAALGYIGAASPIPSASTGVMLADPKDKVAILEAYRVALLDIGAGKVADGANALHDILLKEPAMTEAWSHYGGALLRLGRHEDALVAFQQMVRRQPTDPVALISVGTLLFKLGRYDAARGHARLASAGAPAGAHELLAKIALARRDFDEALNEAAVAEQADPTLPMVDFVRGRIAHDQAGLAQREGSTDRARQTFGEALSHLSRAHDRARRRTMQVAELGYYIGDCLAQLGRYEEAGRLFKEEIGLYPNNLRAHAGLAMTYVASGKTAAAEQTIAAMLAAVPTPDAYRQAADLWRVFGLPDRQAAALATSRARFGK